MSFPRWLLIVAASGLLPLVSVSDGHAIMRRDDVPDKEYVVPAADHPAIVDLLARGDCLGTLITPTWLITAAHCAAYVPASHSIRVGQADRAIAGVVCHPDYGGFEHDVALVHLSQAVSDVSPLELYRDTDEAGQGVLFVGRGDHGTGLQGQAGSSNDGETREATNTVVAVEPQWLEFVFNEVGDPEVTPLEGISGDGDSGGPALIETPSGYRVAGISSWQDAPDDALGTYGVREFYTRVSSYLAFIDDTTGGNWDGAYRSCPEEEEEGCRIGGADVPRGRSTPWLLAVLCPVLVRRRVARARRCRARG